MLGESRNEMKTRRMMDSIENGYKKNKTTAATTITQAPVLAPAPAPEPASTTANETLR